MTTISMIAAGTRSLWIRGGKAGQFLAAMAVGAALALISWQAGVLDTNIFGGLQDSAIAASGPGALVSLGAAFVIGATMIVLPCGYPSVFVMPSILNSRGGLAQRSVLSGLFLLGGACPWPQSELASASPAKASSTCWNLGRRR